MALTCGLEGCALSFNREAGHWLDIATGLGAGFSPAVIAWLVRIGIIPLVAAMWAGVIIGLTTVFLITADVLCSEVGGFDGYWIGKPYDPMRMPTTGCNPVPWLTYALWVVAQG